MQEVCRNVRVYLKQKNGDDKRAEIDISPELNATDAAYYQSLIGILQWMVELGRVDITSCKGKVI